jgi:hypothetical protein
MTAAAFVPDQHPPSPVFPLVSKVIHMSAPDDLIKKFQPKLIGKTISSNESSTVCHFWFTKADIGIPKIQVA